MAVTVLCDWILLYFVYSGILFPSLYLILREPTKFLVCGYLEAYIKQLSNITAGFKLA